VKPELCDKQVYVFGTTPCKHPKFGNGRIVSTVECHGSISCLLCTIKFEGQDELISVYDDEIEIISDA